MFLRYLAFFVVIGLLTPSLLCAQTLDDAAWVLPNLFKHVPKLKHDHAGRFPMIVIEAFKLDKDCTLWREGKPFPPQVIRELKARGLTQWIPPDVKYIEFAKALQAEGAGVIMMQGMAFNGPPDEAPATSMHILPKDYKGLERPAQQPVFPCPLVLDGWVITQEKMRKTFQAYKAAGVQLDAAWLDWEIEPYGGEAQWDEAKHCSRCRAQFPPGVLDDQTQFKNFLARWRTQLFSAYMVAPILEAYPGISVTNWEEVISTHEHPTPNWTGARQLSPRELGMFNTANPVAYGNTWWYKDHWNDERGWPLDVKHMDRIYTSVMFGQVSLHERNRQLVDPHSLTAPWVDRFCDDLKDPKVPIMSRERYREVLRHIWLRGADGMQIFNPLWYTEDAAKLMIATEEVVDAVMIYDELLAHRALLDKGEVMNTEQVPIEYQGPIWSGLRQGDQALVRTFTMADQPVTAQVTAFPDTTALELPAPPQGRWYLLTRKAQTVEVKPISE